MNKTLTAVIGVVGLIAVIGITLLFGAVSFHNKEVDLRTQIMAKQTDNKNQMDSMWKSINQTAQVAEKDRDSLTQLFNEYAQNRGSGGGGIMKWVQESVPNVDNTTMVNLQNIIVSQRDSFKFRQTEILDLSREHNRLLQRFPNNIYAGFLGRKSIDITVVTSSRTERAFETGVDDETTLFNK
jgi:hypothetical protein